MAKSTLDYHFDRFAEFLNVTLAENIARCQLGLNKIHKVRVYLDKDMVWPKNFKVILDNELVASAPSLANDDASYKINYLYDCPSNIAKYTEHSDKVTSPFITKAKEVDSEFYSDAWSLKMEGCIPSILKDLAFRNVCRNLPSQLKHQGIELSEDFEVQFHDGENFLSFSYDQLTQQLKQQIQFYLNNDQVKQLATTSCFKHSENQRWFTQL